MPEETVRSAQRSDAPQMVDLSEQKRLAYQEYQPRFWRKAADSREKQLPFFERLVESDRVIALVHEKGGALDGFVLASLLEAPPVYEPGGLTCMIDDFVVGGAGDWATVGTALLDAANKEAKARGAVQAVVVCGHHDEPKKTMLAQRGFTIASEWYVRDITDGE